MLNIEKLPKPPAFLLASKIICDLQLPNELEVYVKTLDRIINQDDNDAEWKTVLFGNRIPSDAAYAGFLILVAMKLVLGLDGTTEFHILPRKLTIC
ncbi:hypothetical protein DAPPUDRAFT_319854 [Daphnia pulex]|uniref:Uncharacterized protein n=1 Tax=Daphnia pulex TaxID=6669 RepID=E9GN12_DAPPU|nr:hypothetical protein DAPPUDRAFT_319854 [Daphnia pulex]|eukprot:EFX79192.1 hypothetical protein DAPPUDRAFT_319854 [Daphnia pulex]